MVSETATIEAGGPARPVAVNTTGLLLTPLASTRAASVWAPAEGPSLQLPTVAMPWALVTVRPEVTWPPPESTVNVTATPDTTFPDASSTRTLGAIGTTLPAGAD